MNYFYEMKKIALITSGGDAPGMNACVRAIVKTCIWKGIIPVGYFDGYAGMMENRFKEMTSDDVVNIIQRGGTILGTARSEEFRTVEGRKKAIQSLKEKLFPDNGLQERYDNFLAYYLRHGDDFFQVLKDNFDPLEKKFVVVVED